MEKKLLMAIIIVLTLTQSCLKEAVDDSSLPTTNLQNSKELFAQALSKAVYEHEDLRVFIKEVALRQFDRDYDVFYPFVKDEIVSNGKTFRDYILEVISEDKLEKIEFDLPLLDISVPDWEWMDAFSINSWDTGESNIIVGFSSETLAHRVFYNGEAIDELSAGMFPDNPTLIVKENERMKLVEPATKVESYRYEYSDEAFRPEPATRSFPPTITNIPLATDPGTNRVDTAAFRAIYPEAVRAWKEYRRDAYNPQRRLVYFNLHKNESEGTLNPHVKENVIAIKLSNTTCMDDSHEDAVLTSHSYGTPLDENSVEALVNAIWNSGQLEIQLYATTLDRNNKLKVLSDKTIPVHAKKLFDISKVERRFWHKTWFEPRVYKYIGYASDLVPKWYYLESPIYFEHWEPTIESYYVKIHAFEKDGNEKTVIKETLKQNKGVVATLKIDNLFDISINTNGTTTETVKEYSINTGSDDLSSTELSFNDYIITAENNGKYTLKTFNTGNLQFILVPADI